MKLLLISLFSILFATTFFAQKKIVKVKGGYQYDTEIYKSRKLGNILQTNNEAYEQYQEFLNSKNNADFFGIISIVGISAALFVPFRKCRTGGDSPDYECYVPNFYVFVGSCISGVIGIHHNVKANRHFRESIDIWNKDVIKVGTSMEYELKLDATENGFGIVLNF